MSEIFANIIAVITHPFPGPVYDLLLLLLLLLRAHRGYKRGLVRELSSILCIVGSYILASPIGNFLEAPLAQDYPLLLVKPIALTIGGLLGYFGCFFSLLLITSLTGLRGEHTGKKEAVIRWGGTIVGTLFGMLIYAIVVWYVLWAGEIAQVLLAAMPAQDPQQTQSNLTLPAVTMSNHRTGLLTSLVGKLAEERNPFPRSIITQLGTMMEKLQKLQQMPLLQQEQPTAAGTGAVLSGGGGSIPASSGSVITNTGALQKVLQQLPMEKITANASFRAVMQDPSVQELARKKDFVGLMKHPAIRKLLDDPEIMQQMQSIDPSLMMDVLLENPSALQQKPQ